ncbi:MAG: hydrogenase nickel incorporation protein HypA [Candidatus Aureabacteria bacterium]|nr:hydrogenase nickel incorporation protein HypA [Candidatus Auribacterota bacterium]
MHEWALAEAVVVTAIKTAKEHSFREVTDIEIQLGQLQQIDKDVFAFAVEKALKSQRLLFKETKVHFHDEEAVFQCRNCGREWTFEDNKKKLSTTESEAIHFVPEVAHAYMGCPDCQSTDFEILKGRGVSVSSITGERDD